MLFSTVFQYHLPFLYITLVYCALDLLLFIPTADLSSADHCSGRGLLAFSDASAF
jgi:hypothetical protein